MHEGTGAHLYPIHVHTVAVCWFRLGLSKWERLLLILSDFIHSKVISQPTHGCMCVCGRMCVILPGVNKKRNLFTLAPYVTKTCRPNPVYCEYPIYLSSITSPSSLPCSPFLYPSLSPTNSPLIQPPQPAFYPYPQFSFCFPSPSSQAEETGASLGKVWPTTAQWLWVIKVV